jgi:tetratricopeptide (TPR) repeat protein
LVSWHDPPAALAQRNLGLAELEVGEKLEYSPLVTQGFQLLLKCWSGFPSDPALLTGIGEFLIGTTREEDARDAVAVFERVIQAEPNVALHYLHAGLACKAAHNEKKAIAYLEQALERDPLMEEPYRRLGEIYSEARDTGMVRQTYQRYLKAFPQSIEAQTDVRSASVLARGR